MEPTRSQNITVSWRRSPGVLGVGCWVLEELTLNSLHPTPALQCRTRRSTALLVRSSRCTRDSSTRALRRSGRRTFGLLDSRACRKGRHLAPSLEASPLIPGDNPFGRSRARSASLKRSKWLRSPRFTCEGDATRRMRLTSRVCISAPADVSAGLDALVARVERMLGTAKRVAVLAGMRSAKAIARRSATRV